MKHLYDYILTEHSLIALNNHIINESNFKSNYFFHNNYGKMVLEDLLNGYDIILGTKGEGASGLAILNKDDFDMDVIQDLFDNYGKGTPEESMKKFNEACKAQIKNPWQKIWKTPYSSRIKKVGGGINFEDELCKLLQELVLTGETRSESPYKLVAKNLFNKIKNYKAIKFLVDKKPENIGDYIKTDGKGSTARNKYGQILNNDTFEVNINKKRKITEDSIDEVENVLTQSGKIIADIVITTDKNYKKADINHINPDDIYISCKDGDAQLSGIAIQQPFYGNEQKTRNNSYIAQCYREGKSYEEFISKKDNICVISFLHLCNDLMSVDPKTIYNYFAKPVSEREKNVQIKVNKKHERDEIISSLIQLLVGGNYFYVNSGNYTGKKNKVEGGEIIWVDDNIDENKFSFIPNGEGHLEPSLISVMGVLKTTKGDVKAELKFRSSSGDEYPFRLFIVINDKHIISNLYGEN